MATGNVANENAARQNTSGFILVQYSARKFSVSQYLISPMKICFASFSQCLRTANSPFSSVSSIETIRSSVIALGAQRLREILWSSFLVRMTGEAKWPLEPQAFWEHSQGCALISRRLAADIGPVGSREDLSQRSAARRRRGR
jgi:hypothetical protein